MDDYKRSHTLAASANSPPQACGQVRIHAPEEGGKWMITNVVSASTAGCGRDCVRRERTHWRGLPGDDGRREACVYRGFTRG
jgi:hypothetical protein